MLFTIFLAFYSSFLFNALIVIHGMFVEIVYYSVFVVESEIYFDLHQV